MEHAPPIVRAVTIPFDGAQICNYYTDVVTQEMVAEYELMIGKSPHWKIIGIIEERSPRQAHHPVWKRKPRIWDDQLEID